MSAIHQPHLLKLSRPASHRQRRARLCLEALEDRTVPAVTASLSNGTLSVLGDASDNVIAVSHEIVDRIIVDIGNNGTADFVFRRSLVSRIVVDGREGNDLVLGVPDNGATAIPTTILGGGGNDRLFGSPGNDVMDGGAGDDLLVGRLGDDILRGGTGQDALFGDFRPTQNSVFSNQLFTVPGADLLEGGDGDDLLEGGAGNDQLFGEAGRDRLSGDLGAFIEQDNFFNLDGLRQDVRDLLGRVIGTDLLDGGNGDDLFLGSPGADLVLGGFGNDIFSPRDPQSVQGFTFIGGDGIDGTVFSGTKGDDAIRVGRQEGANGPQVVIQLNGETVVGNYSEGETIFVFGGAGNDAILMDESAAGTWRAEFHGQGGNDQLTGGALDDLLDGGTGNDLLQGLGGDDVLLGKAGNDILQGGDGADDLAGGNGHDLLQGDAGDDRLDGGLGRDTFQGGTGTDRLFAADFARDFLYTDLLDLLQDRDPTDQAWSF